MKVKHQPTVSRRRIFTSMLMGVMLCEAAPVALAEPATSYSEDSASASASLLEMYRGEVRILRVPGTIKRVAIGNGKLVTANVVDGRLMLLGEAAGVTSLVVWNEKGIALQTTVRVAKGDVNASLDQLRAVLQSVPGLRIQSVGPNIVLSGVVHRDMAPLVKAATEDLKNVIDTTTVDEGDALKKTIHFKVQIMEITRTGQQNLGIAWDSQFNGPQIGGAASVATGAATAVTAGTSYFLAGIASNITSKINFAVNNGDAFILAAPELNTKSGGTATFLAGGEVPIPKAGALGTTDVDYKPYGITLNIKPVVDANNIISANLQTEISQIDPSVSYGGFPGFMTRRTSSDISMRAGETIAISGLISADALSASNGMPFLGQLPIIGQLFRSDSFRSKKSDLVIFVTPVISDPALSPNTDLLARADKLDAKYRSSYGNPSPLAATEWEDSTPATRHPIAPTRAVSPAPVRNTPVQAPAVNPAPVTNSTPPPAPAPAPAIGLVEAIRMLDTAKRPPVAAGNDAPTAPVAPTDRLTDPAPTPPAVVSGKVPAQQVGVLGNSGN
ncbi:pilus assembly protein N-terminal domain-containing protein [Paraburkholderia sp. IW21]|uniref:type II and III secretion system protein family protein n=1 Tax=Paraburkholderia sp. IW21 TaxID=3242488 RepID=UPI003521C51C